MQSALVSRTFTPSTAVMLALVLTLAACSSKQPNKVLNSGSGGITIEYDTRYPTMAGVDADEHCAKFGKVAKRVETKSADTMERVSHRHAAVAVFACENPGGAGRSPRDPLAVAEKVNLPLDNSSETANARSRR